MVEVMVGFGLVEIYEFNDAEDGKDYYWNASEGRRIADARNEIHAVSLGEAGMTTAMIRKLAPDLDVRKAMAMHFRALLVPLLFVPHGGKHVLIDGWHRVYRASIAGIDELPAWILTEQEAASIRLEENPCTG